MARLPKWLLTHKKNGLPISSFLHSPNRNTVEKTTRARSNESSTMSSPKPQAKSPSILDDFKMILAEQKHMYACGGRIPIATATSEIEAESLRSPAAEQPRQSAPVTIRWDASGIPDEDVSPCRRLTLPITKQADRDALNGLVKDCQPATFGLGGEDVYDETYRKALKLDTDAFCSTFDPHSLGIVDSIAQILLPSFLDSTTHPAVEARLYKLNVSSCAAGPRLADTTDSLTLHLRCTLAHLVCSRPMSTRLVRRCNLGLLWFASPLSTKGDSSKFVIKVKRRLTIGACLPVTPRPRILSGQHFTAIASTR